MRPRTRTTVIVGTVSLVALMGLGLATYLFGGSPTDSVTAGAVPIIDTEKPPLKSYEPTTVLRLRFGKGPEDVWVDREWAGPTVESFDVNDEGDVLVTDHPSFHKGARVRRFSAAGVLERTWLTPAGSVFFGHFGTGIMYVTTRDVAGQEHVWLTTEDGSVETSFPVPPGVNSTGLFRVGDLLVVSSEVAELTAEPESVRIAPKVFPVVLLTPDGPVDAPDPTAMPGYGRDTAGGLYERLLESDGQAIHAGTTQTVTLSDRRALRVPGLSTPVGVDGDEVWTVMPVAVASDSVIERAGWPLGSSGEAEIIAGRVDGRLVTRLIIPWSPLLRDTKRRALVTKEGLWVLTADTDGVSILKYTEASR